MRLNQNGMAGLDSMVGDEEEEGEGRKLVARGVPKEVRKAGGKLRVTNRCPHTAEGRRTTQQPRTDRDSPTSRWIAFAIGIDDRSYGWHAWRPGRAS